MRLLQVFKLQYEAAWLNFQPVSDDCFFVEKISCPGSSHVGSLLLLWFANVEDSAPGDWTILHNSVRGTSQTS